MSSHETGSLPGSGGRGREGAFSPAVWKKAEEIVSSGKIVAFASVEGFYEADVQGSAGEVYRVKVLLEEDRLRSGTCSCPSRRPCKHIAAVILRATEAGGRPGPGLPGDCRS